MPNYQFLNPLKTYLEVIEQTTSKVVKCLDQEKLCLSKDPIAVMNIWETLIEAQRNEEFKKFMLTMGITEDQFSGSITGWNIYKHKRPLMISKQIKLDGSVEILEITNRLVYIPETKEIDDYGNSRDTLGPLNPYKSFKVSHATVSRTIRNIETLDLEFVYSIVFTLPKEVSDLYKKVSRPDKIDLIVDKCIKDLSAYLTKLFGSKIGMAVNKHVWSSAKPLDSHVHLHVLLLDRLISKDKEDQIIPGWFMKYNDRTRRYEEGSLTKILKRNWALIVNKEFNLDYQELDIRIEFIELKKKDGSENLTGIKKLIHKLKYNRRRPISDLALYYLFNKFDLKDLDQEFSEHLINYENRTRIYGYWSRMSKYAKVPKEDLKVNEIRCPVCYETLVYVSFYDQKELPENVKRLFLDRKGQFWALDPRRT